MSKKEIPYNDMLIEFMILKSKKLWKSYLLPEDIDAMRKWSKASSKKVWKELENNILIDEETGVNECTCPFCIKYLGYHRCYGCEYSKNRGSTCLDFDSSYEIEDLIKEARILKNKEEIQRLKKSYAYQSETFFERKKNFDYDFFIDIINKVKKKYGVEK